MTFDLGNLPLEDSQPRINQFIFKQISYYRVSPKSNLNYVMDLAAKKTFFISLTFLYFFTQKKNFFISSARSAIFIHSTDLQNICPRRLWNDLNNKLIVNMILTKLKGLNPPDTYINLNILSEIEIKMGLHRDLRFCLHIYEVEG